MYWGPLGLSKVVHGCLQGAELNSTRQPRTRNSDEPWYVAALAQALSTLLSMLETDLKVLRGRCLVNDSQMEMLGTVNGREGALVRTRLGCYNKQPPTFQGREPTS